MQSLLNIHISTLFMQEYSISENKTLQKYFIVEVKVVVKYLDKNHD